jgi:xylulose-5-phosphate/fructose-6-phosphate phosphoketolase
VHGFREEGTTTTPFDMAVLNELDRYHLALAAIERVPGLAERAKDLAAELHGKLAEHKAYVREYGEDMPEIQQWNWPYNGTAEAGD